MENTNPGPWSINTNSGAGVVKYKLGLGAWATAGGRETQILDKMNLMVFQNVLFSLIFSSFRFSKYFDFLSIDAQQLRCFE